MSRRGWAVAAVAAVALIAGAPTAAAHPLGNLSVNTYDGVVVRAGSAAVDHVEDLAEIPALAAVRAADGNGDGRLGAGEARDWAAERCRQAAGRIVIRRSGVLAPLRVRGAEAVERRGSAGLPLLRLECRLEDGRRLDGATELDVDVAPAADVGWREVTLAGDGTTVRQSDVPARSVSGRLTAYPTADPRADTSAHATVTPVGRRSWPSARRRRRLGAG
jgi:nickel/cobalt transporter (NicO) family protein